MTEREVKSGMRRKIIILAIAVIALCCIFAFSGCSEKGKCRTRHEFTVGECVWNDDGTAYVIVKCEVCGETITEEADVKSEEKTAATCEEGGKAVLTATVSIGGNTFNTFTKEEDISAQGHKYGEAEYKWTSRSGVQYCTATKKCSVCGDEIEEQVKASYSVKKESTCSRAGEGVYTAKFSDKDFDRQTKTVELAKLDHIYGNEITYSWVNHKCTATQKCINCGDAKRETASEIRYEVLREKTCTEDGLGRYTATFENPLYETQTEDAVIKAGHTYGAAEYKWEENGEGGFTCTATKHCEKCDSYETEIGKVSISDKKDADCITDGYIKYKAVFETMGTSLKEVELPNKGGHDYAEPEYEWSNDYGYCTAKRTCNECGDEISEKVKSVKTVVKEKTCTENGLITFTAEFSGDGYETQIKEITVPMSHEEGNTVYTWNEDRTSCKAEKYCSECGEVIATAEAYRISYTETKPATCTETGKGVYTAYFPGEYENQKYEVTVPVKPHEYSEPMFMYSWEDDTLICTATKTCAGCGKIVTETKSGKFVKVEVTQEGTVKVRYEVEFENFDTQSYEFELTETEE